MFLEEEKKEKKKTPSLVVCVTERIFGSFLGMEMHGTCGCVLLYGRISSRALSARDFLEWAIIGDDTREREKRHFLKRWIRENRKEKTFPQAHMALVGLMNHLKYRKP